MKKKILYIGAVVALIASAYGLLCELNTSFCNYHRQFAQAKEVRQLSTDFQYFTLNNQAAELRRRMWEYEKECQCLPEQMPLRMRQEYRKLEEERNRILRKLEKLEERR